MAAAGRGAFKKSALMIGDGAEIIERTIRDGGYRRVLEIGTYRGVTAAFMAQFVDRVTTIDLVRGRMERHGETFDRWRFWESLGISNIDLRLIETDIDKATVIRESRFDFAFIDADHVAPAPEKDFALVRSCGAVLFHDYGENNGVTAFVDTLPKEQVTINDIFAFWKQDSRG